MPFDELSDQEVEHRLARAEDRERAIRCRACAAAVTAPAARVERDGAHHHVRTNPQGLRFELGCFSSARGCRAIGKPTEAWTWFPGWAWQVALCAACATHLGWRFTPAAPGPADEFFGLILERLS